MAGYNWEQIVSKYSNSHLQRVFRERNLEPEEKVLACIKELQKRSLMKENDAMAQLQDSHRIISVNDYFLSLKSNTRRAKQASYMILVVLFIDILKIPVDYYQYSLLSDFKTGLSVSEPSIMLNLMLQIFLSLLYLIFYIISAVTFIMWFRRAYYNLQRRVPKCGYSNGWAAGGWFVPILSLYVPYDIMAELWKKTSDLLKVRIGSHCILPKKPIIRWWWATWIIISIAGNILSRFDFYKNELDQLLFQSKLNLAISIGGIVLAIITYFMIKQFSKMEEMLFAEEKSQFELLKESQSSSSITQ